MNILTLSLNLLRRDWRAGEWRVLLLALVLAVGSLSTVGLFADRVRQALQQQAQSLIGADLRITSTRPLPLSYRAAAQARGLQTVLSETFPSMVLYRDQSLLSDIEAVEPGYPLRGKIVIDDGHEHTASAIPAPGTIWADPRLLRRLNVKLGDEVGLGKLHFTVAASIVRDIDQSIGFSGFAPHVLMNMGDLAATGLQQEGSRISYRLMFAGNAAEVSALRDELKNKLSGNANGYARIEDVRDARPEIRSALERAEHFLGLAALTAAILAGAAMALAARRFVVRHLDSCAVMRCLGAQQNQILLLFFYQFVLLGFIAVLAGCGLGYATQAGLIHFVASLRNADLPQPTVLPALKASLSGFALLLGFTFLPLLQLRKVSPLRVMRRELGMPPASAGLMYAIAMLVLAGLFLWQAGSIKLGLTMLGGLLAGLLLFGGLAALLLRGLPRLVQITPQWRHVFSNLARGGNINALQVVAFSLGGMALLLLTLVRGDLLRSWQDKLPPDTPNRFVVNIQPGQKQAVLDFFAREQLAIPQLMPMVRGRLIAINGRPVNGDSYPDQRARALVEREFNLSWAEQLPPWNEVEQGQWPNGSNIEGQLSVETGIAQTLGIHLGDRLTYDVAGDHFTAPVTSLRKLQWDSMRVNFFVIATPGLLKDYPASYLTSFYLPPDKVRVGDLLAQRFSNLLVIDTGAVIEQVRNIMAQIAQTMSVVFVFTLLSGLAVLYAALLATQDERILAAAILRTLGADSRYLRRLHLGEFAVLGLLSGLFSAAGAVLLGWVLARFVLEIPYQTGIAIWLLGGLAGIAVVMLAGWLGTRRLTMLPPLAILRE